MCKRKQEALKKLQAANRSYHSCGSESSREALCASPSQQLSGGGGVGGGGGGGGGGQVGGGCVIIESAWA